MFYNTLKDKYLSTIFEDIEEQLFENQFEVEIENNKKFNFYTLKEHNEIL